MVLACRSPLLQVHIPEGLTLLDLDVIKLTVCSWAARGVRQGSGRIIDWGVHSKAGRVGPAAAVIQIIPLSPLHPQHLPFQAQFVARNGKSFLTGLASREHANPQVRRWGRACAAAWWCKLAAAASTLRWFGRQ